MMLTADTVGNGRLAVSDDGSEPVFDDEHPAQSMSVSANMGDTLTISARAEEGWKFVCWTNNDTGEVYSEEATVTVVAESDLNLTAVFADIALVTVTANVDGNGIVAVSDDGSEPVFDDEHPAQSASVSADKGNTITISAKAEEGWKFVNWINADTGEFYSDEATVAIEAESDLNLTAVFADVALVTVTANVEGNGILAVSDDGSEPVFDDEHPAQSASVSADKGNTITLSAKAEEGWRFVYWVNADTGEICSEEATVAIEAESDLNLTAVFADTALVTVMANVDGEGILAYSDDGSEPVFDDEHPTQIISVNADVGDSITFSAKPVEGWKFVYWVDNDEQSVFSMEDTVTVSVTGNKSLTAVFADASLVTISASTTGNGTLAISDDGSELVFDDKHPAQSVSTSIGVGEKVTLGAKADKGWRFVNWIDEDKQMVYSTDETIYIEANEALNLTAVFADNSSVVVSAYTIGEGWIAFSDDGSEPVFDDKHPSQSISVSVNVGDTVVLSAKTDEDNYKFIRWTNATTGEHYSYDQTITIDVTESIELIAEFDYLSLENCSILVNTIGKGQITCDFVDGEPVFHTDMPVQSISMSVPMTEDVFLGAKADEGYKFLYWLDALTDQILTTSEVYIFSVHCPESLVAVFEKIDVEEPILAEHTTITYDRKGDGFAIRTTSKSDTVAIRIDGGTAATEGTEGLSIDNGVVSISKELADRILKDGENHLHLVFSDGTIEIIVYVTNEGSTVVPDPDFPKTGTSASPAAVAMMILSGLTAALFLAVKRKKD